MNNLQASIVDAYLGRLREELRERGCPTIGIALGIIEDGSMGKTSEPSACHVFFDFDKNVVVGQGAPFSPGLALIDVAQSILSVGIENAYEENARVSTRKRSS